MNEEKTDLIFIKGFSKIKISNACKYFGFNQANLVNGKSGRLKEKLVRKYIENELSKLYKADLEELKCQEK